MYAIIKTGGKQLKIEEGMNFKVEKLAGEVGNKLSIEDVLFVGGNGSPKIGTPRVDGAKVTVEILRHAKDKKVMVYKKKRRKGYEKRHGHRQEFTEIKIDKIEAS